jgi:hypothetical protein
VILEDIIVVSLTIHLGVKANNGEDVKDEVDGCCTEDGGRGRKRKHEHEPSLKKPNASKTVFAL